MIEPNKIRLRHDRVLVRLLRAKPRGPIVLASTDAADAKVNHLGTAAIVEAVGPGLTARVRRYPADRPLQGAEETRQAIVSDIDMPMLVAPGDVVILGQRYAGAFARDDRLIVALEEIDAVVEASEDDVATSCPELCVLGESRP